MEENTYIHTYIKSNDNKVGSTTREAAGIELFTEPRVRGNFQ